MADFQLGIAKVAGNPDITEFSPNIYFGTPALTAATLHIGTGWPPPDSPGPIGINDSMDFGDLAAFNAGPPYTPTTLTGYCRVQWRLSNGATLDTGVQKVERGPIIGIAIIVLSFTPGVSNTIELRKYFVDGGTETVAGPITVANTVVPAVGPDSFFWYSDVPGSDRPPSGFPIPTGSPPSVPIPIITSGPDGPVPNPGGGPGNTPEDKGGGPGSGWPGDPNTLVGGTAWRTGWYVDSASGNYVVVSS